MVFPAASSTKNAMTNFDSDMEEVEKYGFVRTKSEVGEK